MTKEDTTSVFDFSQIPNRLNEIWKVVDRENLESLKKKSEKKISKEQFIAPFLSPGILQENVNSENVKLVVIGLNPSYSVDGWIGILSGHKIKKNYSPSLRKLIEIATKLKDKDERRTIDREKIKRDFEDDLNKYFEYQGSLMQNWIKEVRDIEYRAFKSHNYFKKMRFLAWYIYQPESMDKAPWIHIDLFFYRVTSQNDLKWYIKNIDVPENSKRKSVKKKELKDSEFFNQQLFLTREIISYLNPEFILIANAFAGEVFRDMYYMADKSSLRKELIENQDKEDFKYFVETELDEEYRKALNGDSLNLSDEQYKKLRFVSFHNKYFKPDGTYHLGKEILKTKNEIVKVFFSGMLSGQRALDLGSFERMKWHMKAVKEGNLKINASVKTNPDH